MFRISRRGLFLTCAGLLIAHVVYAVALLGGYYLRVGATKRHHIESACFVLVGLLLTVGALNRPRAQSSSEPSSPASAPRHRGGTGTGADTYPDADSDADAPWMTRLLRWAPAIFVVAAFVLYAPALGVGLLSDDFTLLHRTLSGQAFLTSGVEHVRPAPLLIWGAIASVVSDPAVWLHALNVALHGLNAWLVFRLAGRWIAGMRNRLLAGVLFLAFPASVEAVAWISGIQDVLMTTAVLAAMTIASADRVSAYRAHAGVAVLTVLALATKETAVALPALILIGGVGGNEPASRRVRSMVPLVAAICAVYVVWRLTTIPLAANYHPPTSRYELTQLLSRPFAALASPWSDAVVARAGLVGFFGALVPVVLLVWNAVLDRQRRPWWIGPAAQLAIWILAGVAPLSTYFFVAADLSGSRYLYLPAAAWAILLAFLLDRARPTVSRRAVSAAVTIGATLLCVIWIWGLRVHLQPWHRAADLRDRALEGGAAVLRGSGCRNPEFLNPPDSLEGVHVFRNGFREALLMKGIAFAAGAPDCRLEWTAGAWRIMPAASWSRSGDAVHRPASRPSP